MFLEVIRLVEGLVVDFHDACVEDALHEVAVVEASVESAVEIFFVVISVLGAKFKFSEVFNRDAVFVKKLLIGLSDGVGAFHSGHGHSKSDKRSKHS